MTFLKLNQKGKTSFRFFVFLLLLFLSVILTERNALADSKECVDLDEDDYSIFFFMSGCTGEYQKTCPVGLWVQSETTLVAIHMNVAWDSTKLIFDKVDFSPWTDHFPGDDVDTSYNLLDSGNVELSITEIDPRTINPGKSIANIWLKLKCIESGDTGWVVYNGRCTDNIIVTPGGKLYGPLIFGTKVTMGEIDHILSPAGDTSLINDTAEITVEYSYEFIADNGFYSYWEFPKDSLDFVSVIKVGDLLSSDPQDSVDESTDPAKLFISYNGSIDSTPSPETIFKIRFKNTMNHNYSEATVKRILDTLKICDEDNSELQSIITDTASATLTTFYQATMKIWGRTACTNRNNVDLPVRLSNNFWVDLQSGNEISKFRIDDSSWTLISWFDWEDLSGPGWKWYRMPGIPYNKQFTNNTASDTNIWPYTYCPRNISNMIINVGPDTGWQPVNILPDTTKLKDAFSNLTIYANGWIYSDSGIALVPESVHVVDCPGCPFVYVWNGTEFEEDNTILASSEIYPQEPMTDYYLLSRPLVSTNDEYHIQIREFENEVSYIDRIKLVAVDHSPDIQVGVTPQGRFFGFDRELEPIACVDQNGKDHLLKIISKDGVYFTSEEPGYLLVTYTTRKVWLGNSENSSFTGPLAAGGLPEPPPPQKRAGVISNLSVEIQDMHGYWHKLGNVPPRFYPERSFCILEAKDLELSEEFRVKISWDRYWTADELRYYVPSQEQPTIVWTRPISAVNSENGEVLKEIFNIDEEYVTIMPGQTIELAFPAVRPSEPETVRDFVLQTTGYYISLKKPSTAPNSLALLNNYPNPFNASTVILYTLPQATDVKLEIFNLLGQRIRVLVDEQQSAGYRKVIWDGKDDKGRDVSSGIYFYRLQTEDYSDSKKMVLMR
jgi:hypothetical protein